MLKRNEERERMGTKRRSSTPTWIRSSYIAYIFLILWTILQLFPITWLLYSSFKSNEDIYDYRWMPPSPTNIRLENYDVAWTGKFENVTVGQYLINSVIITFFSLIILVFIAALTGYSITRLDLRGGKPIFYLFLILIAVPPASLIVPLFVEIRVMELLNHHVGLILPYIAYSLPFSVVVARAFYTNFPTELEESAKLDGCNEISVFRRIVLPLSRNLLAVLAIVNFAPIWNELLFALIIMHSNPMKTLGPGLMGFTGQYYSRYDYMFAGLSIAIIPMIIFYIIFQKQIIRGVLTGSIKG